MQSNEEKAAMRRRQTLTPMIYLYAITHDLQLNDLDDLLGLGSEPLKATTVEGLTAVFNEVSADTVRLDEATMWRHERVIESLMRDHTVLPARFGTTFSDHEALWSALDRRRAALEANLQEVAGKVELGVRVIRHGSQGEDRVMDEGSPTSGRDYILGKVQEHRRRDAEIAEARRSLESLHQSLESLSSGARARWAVSADTLLAAAYLVDEDRVEDFREEVARAEEEEHDLGIFCTGPWPPYNFVDLQAGAEGGALDPLS
jgi:hypothetical protein